VSRRAVFLDRDGTLNVRPQEHQYVADVADFVWLPGAAEAVVQFSRAGYVITVVSNQRGLARGLVTIETLRHIEDRIQRDLARGGAGVAAFRYCLHELDDRCECRKPRPGLLLQLASDLDLDLSTSWTIGDSDSDVLAGQAAGTLTALLGFGPRTSEPDLVAASLLDAAHAIGAADQDARLRPAGSARPPATNSSTSA